MSTTTNSRTYRFPLVTDQDANRISSMAVRLEDEGRLILVKVFPIDDHSFSCNLQYLLNPNTPKQPHPYLKYLVDNHAHAVIEIIITA